MGPSSKVSTKYSSKSKKVSYVICVYTYDWTDEKDARRVREELRKIGVINKIPYKADVDTILGKYAETMHRKISRYFE